MPLVKSNSVFTEEHSVIEGILNSNKLDSETKLLAIAEILRLEASDKLWSDPEYKDDIDDLFEWADSELGIPFWEHIQDAAFTSGKREC